jgi:hypothetical protein
LGSVRAPTLKGVNRIEFWLMVGKARIATSW